MVVQLSTMGNRYVNGAARQGRSRRHDYPFRRGILLDESIWRPSNRRNAFGIGSTPLKRGSLHSNLRGESRTKEVCGVANEEVIGIGNSDYNVVFTKSQVLLHRKRGTNMKTLFETLRTMAQEALNCEAEPTREQLMDCIKYDLQCELAGQRHLALYGENRTDTPWFIVCQEERADVVVPAYMVEQAYKREMSEFGNKFYKDLDEFYPQFRDVFYSLMFGLDEVAPVDMGRLKRYRRKNPCRCAGFMSWFKAGVQAYCMDNGFNAYAFYRK